MVLDTSDRLVRLILAKWRPLTWKLGPFYRFYAYFEFVLLVFRVCALFQRPKTFTLVRLQLVDVSRHLRQVGKANTDEITTSDVEIRPLNGKQAKNTDIRWFEVCVYFLTTQHLHTS
jgi:hypothetical protein